MGQVDRSVGATDGCESISDKSYIKAHQRRTERKILASYVICKIRRKVRARAGRGGTARRGAAVK